MNFLEISPALTRDDITEIEKDLSTVFPDEFIALLENYFPLGIVPFAVDDGGNFFCISSRKIDFEKIYFLENEHYDIQRKESEYLTLVENTFTDFIDGLS